MKSRFVQYSAVSSLLAAIAFTPATALAEYKCNNPTVRIDQRACAKAAEGIECVVAVCLAHKDDLESEYGGLRCPGRAARSQNRLSQPCTERQPGFSQTAECD